MSLRRIFMVENVNLYNVSCIVPVKGKRIASKVIYIDGTSIIIHVRPLTIITWIAKKNYIDINRVIARSRELNFQRKGVPIPVSVRDAFLPIHLVDEMDSEHPCFGYCNAVNQDVDVLPVKGENRRSKLIFHNGIELLVELGPIAISSSLSKTIATHRRFLHELLNITPQNCSL